MQAQGVAQDPAHIPKLLYAEDAKESSGGATLPVLENYLSIDSKERILLAECVELCGVDIPQSRGDDAQLQHNLILAFVACGYKCPIKLCGYRIATRSGKVAKQNLERDVAGHLLHLSDTPQMREAHIFDHCKQHHCPASTIARVKALFPCFDVNGQGCSS